MLRTVSAYLTICLAVVFGAGSVVSLGVFLYLGPLRLVELGLGAGPALLINACLCLQFFLQHSTMLRKTVRKILERFLPSHYFGAWYAIVSGLALFILVVLWQPAGPPLWQPSLALRLIFLSLLVLGLVIMAWGALALRSFDSLGISNILDHVAGRPQERFPFVVRGPYQWVRHPLYLACLLIFWGSPNLTPDRLLFNLLFTAWVVLASRLEERDLVDLYGEPYRRYQQEVPMLVPRHLRPQPFNPV